MTAIKLLFGAVAVLVVTAIGLMFAALPYAVAIVMAVLLLRACS